MQISNALNANEEQFDGNTDTDASYPDTNLDAT